MLWWTSTTKLNLEGLNSDKNIPLDFPSSCLFLLMLGMPLPWSNHPIWGALFFSTAGNPFSIKVANDHLSNMMQAVSGEHHWLLTSYKSNVNGVAQLTFGCWIKWGCGDWNKMDCVPDKLLILQSYMQLHCTCFHAHIPLILHTYHWRFSELRSILMVITFSGLYSATSIL